mgnify:CR=1 FL=1
MVLKSFGRLSISVMSSRATLRLGIQIKEKTALLCRLEWSLSASSVPRKGPDLEKGES